MITREIAFQELISQVKSKVHESREYLDGLIDSRNNDTKSSAGDKYETGRSMMQQEIDRAEERIHQLKVQLNELERLRNKDESKKCEPGSLVIVEDEYFLLGPAIGKVEIQEYIVFSISVGSPLGRLLAGKKEKELIQFRGKPREIRKVL